MIQPTNGRIVWFHPAGDRHFGGVWDGITPLAATIVHVHNERLVNLAVFDMYGSLNGVQDVPLLQDDDVAIGSTFAEWMPYQKGQAAKVEQLEGEREAEKLRRLDALEADLANAPQLGDSDKGPADAMQAPGPNSIVSNVPQESPEAPPAVPHPLDRDGDGQPGGSLPASERLSDELIAEARALGIDLRGSAETVQAQIEEKRAEQPPPG